MSQALQSLNAILKYKQERERQKIDKSLAMLDMGRRLQREEREAAFQSQTMALRDAEERRKSSQQLSQITKDKEELDRITKQNKKLDLEIKVLEDNIKSESYTKTQENIEREKELGVLIKEFNLEEAVRTSKEKANDAFKTNLERGYYQDSENLIDMVKDSGIIPAVVLSKVETALSSADAFDISAIQEDIRNATKGQDNAQYINKTFGENSKFGDALILSLSESLKTKNTELGIQNNSYFMESLENFFNSAINNRGNKVGTLQSFVNFQGEGSDKIWYQLNNQIKNLQDNKKSFDNILQSASLQQSLNRVATSNVNKQLKAAADLIAEQKGLDFDSRYSIEPEVENALLQTKNPKTGKNFTIEEIEKYYSQ